MAKTIFITEDYAKAYANIDDNVGAKTIAISIADAQDMFIEPLLGTRLTNKLTDDIVANTLTGNYKILLEDYVAPALVRFAEYQLIPSNHYRIRNKGLTTKQSESSTSASRGEVSFRMNLAKEKADHYAMKLVDYLKCNTNLFPEYGQSTEGGELKPSNSAASTTWYLGQRSRVKRNYDKGKNCKNC